MSLSNIQIYNPNTVWTSIFVSLTSTATIAATSVSAPYLSAIQSNVADFGATRADNWLVQLSAYMNTAPAAGQTLDVYIAWGLTNAATGTFPGGLTIGSTVGAMTNYNAYGANSVANGLPQLEYVGSMVLAPNTGWQIANIGVISPKLEFGVTVLVNNSGGVVGGTVATTAPTVTYFPIMDEVGA
jgi:hypothetical protein